MPPTTYGVVSMLPVSASSAPFPVVSALVVVTHNRLLAARADRVLSLESGRLVPLSGVESMP